MFSADEDKAILNFAIENLDVADEKSIWEMFKAQTGSENRTDAICLRFHNLLLPQLANAQLPTEDKLKLCKKYKMPISGEFLKNLQNEADVTLNTDTTLESYKMKVATNGNRPQMGVNCGNHEYTPEDDQAIWDYVLGNYETVDYSRSFWEDFARKSVRTIDSVYHRFNTILGMKIHEQDFVIETKLKLYQWCQFPVNVEYVKTLNEHANLKMKRGRIIGYEMLLEGRREKRKKRSDETGKRAKRTRIDGDNNEGVEFESSPKAMPNRKIDNLQVVSEITKVINGIISPFSVKMDSFDEKLMTINKTITEKMDNYEEKLTTIKQNITEKMDNFDEKLTNISKEMGEVSSKVDSLKDQVEVIRKEISSEPIQIDEESEPTKKAYLQMMKDYLALFKTSEFKDIQDRIDVALQNPLDDVAGPDRKKVIRSALENTLLMLTGKSQ